jgi:NRPS condensation-like uncharacterized protein
LDGRIDIPRLKDAITQSCQIVPEVLCSFDIKKERWVDCGFTADAAVLEDTNDFGCGWRWDLFSGTQFKISVSHHAKGDGLFFAFSHILGDGIGFKQYLYLLADIYNSGTLPAQTKNKRDIRPFIRGIRLKPLPEGMGCSRTDATKRLPFNESSDYSRPEGKDHGSCLRERLSKDDFAALKVYVKSFDCTVNDALLAAYARVVARILDTNFVVLPCPTDLRQFFTKQPALTIANMVGAYWLPITIGSNDGFDTTLRQVHESLQLLKESRICFAGIRTMGLLGDILPPARAQALVKRTSLVLPNSYTNMGIVDEQKLRFESCVTTDCFLTGSYRHSPGFQLSVSSFCGELSLCNTVLGSDQRRELCRGALKQIKDELVDRQ